MMLSVIAGPEGQPHSGGMVFADGAYDLISGVRKMDTDWDENGYQTALRASVKTRGGKSYEVTGKVQAVAGSPCAVAASGRTASNSTPASPKA